MTRPHVPRGNCEFCKRDVIEGQSAAFRVCGWEVERRQGGANQILGRERQPDRIVHARCLEEELRLERLGLRDQLTL